MPNPYLNAFKEFVEEFRRESDRAAVILGAARLDAILYQIIQKRLVPSTTGTDELLDGDAPLGTFSSRINLTYRLGIIDAHFARALHLVRKIRNAFAHELSSSSLDSGSHRDRVRELVAPFRSAGGFGVFRRAFFEAEEGISIDFRCTLAVMAARLEAIFEKTDPLDQLGVWTLVPPETEEERKSRVSTTSTEQQLNEQLGTPDSNSGDDAT